jgi:hypothetical protein
MLKWQVTYPVFINNVFDVLQFYKREISDVIK